MSQLRPYTNEDEQNQLYQTYLNASGPPLRPTFFNRNVAGEEDVDFVVNNPRAISNPYLMLLGFLFVLPFPLIAWQLFSSYILVAVVMAFLLFGVLCVNQAFQRSRTILESTTLAVFMMATKFKKLIMSMLPVVKLLVYSFIPNVYFFPERMLFPVSSFVNQEYHKLINRFQEKGLAKLMTTEKEDESHTCSSAAGDCCMSPGVGQDKDLSGCT